MSFLHLKIFQIEFGQKHKEFKYQLASYIKKEIDLPVIDSERLLRFLILTTLILTIQINSG